MLSAKYMYVCLMLIINISLLTRAMDQQDEEFRLGPVSPDVNPKVARLREILRNNSKENPENLELALGIVNDVLSQEKNVSPQARSKIEAIKKNLEAKKTEVLEQLDGFEMVADNPQEEQEPGSPQSFGRPTIVEYWIKPEEQKE